MEKFLCEKMLSISFYTYSNKKAHAFACVFYIDLKITQ